METVKKFDFIIIGSGIAGLNCALHASKKGTVLLITKKHLRDCNTYLAQGGVATVMSKTDNFKKHIEDTLKAGHYHNNKKAVEFIIKNGPASIKNLIKLGMNFSKKAKKIALSLEGGHQEKRIIHSGDTTGKAIEETLLKNVKSNKNIFVKENIFVKDLLIHNGTCYGIQGIVNNKAQNIFAKKTVLATGGLGQIYSHTTNPSIATGDGIAMTYRAGGKLKDLEFIQFHPTALDKKASPLFLLTEALRGEGAYLINSKGERFMKKIHPLAELAPRDIVSIAIVKEQKKGKVYLDLKHLPQTKLKQKYPFIYKKLLNQKLHPSTQPIPIIPAAHYSCGGIITNLKGETNIKDLLAYGETTCTGLHGANRLASNSLLEGLVMSEQIAKIPLVQKAFITSFPLMKIQKQKSTLIIRRQIQNLMWKKVGIIRSVKELKKALIKLTYYKKRLPKATDIESLTTKNILTVAILVTKAALKRKKTLGTHQLI